MNLETDLLSDQREVWRKSYLLEKTSGLWSEPPIAFLDYAIARLKELKAVRVLDAGCGDGRNTRYLVPEGFCVTGVDISVPALNRCKNQMDDAGILIHSLTHSDLALLPYLNGYFDAVVVLDVLGHIPNLTEVLSELKRVTRPGGYLIASFFSLEDSTRDFFMEKIGENIFLYKRYGKAVYYRYFSEENVRRVLSDAGLRIREMKCFSWVDPPHEGFREEEHKHESWVAIGEH